MLLEGQHVGHELAGVRRIGQAVDDRHRRVLREFVQLRHAVGAQHDGVHVARQDAGGVGRGFAAAGLHVAGTQNHDVAAKLAHPDLERDARSGGGLFENHRQGLARERAGTRRGFA